MLFAIRLSGKVSPNSAASSFSTLDSIVVTMPPPLSALRPRWPGLRVRLNGWSEIRLEPRHRLFTVEDWKAMRAGLRSAEVDLEDVRAAVRVEVETARAF